jgi:hypothetical protein
VWSRIDVLYGHASDSRPAVLRVTGSRVGAHSVCSARRAAGKLVSVAALAAWFWLAVALMMMASL